MRLSSVVEVMRLSSVVEVMRLSSVVVVVVVVVVVGYTPTQRPREVRFFLLWWCFFHLNTCLMLRTRDVSLGVGWGGVGMMTYLALAHMFDATHTGCFSRGGVGWGWWRSSDLHTWCYASHGVCVLGLGWWRSSDLHTWCYASHGVRCNDIIWG